MKKMLTLIAVLLLAAFLLAGCNRDGGGGGGADGERGRVSFSMQVGGLLAEGYEDPFTIDWIQDTLNIDIEFIAVTGEALPLMAVAGDLPNLFETNTFMHPHFFEWVDQGIIRSIPREIIARNPYVQAAIDSSREVAGIGAIRGGEIWFYPRPFDVNPLMLTSPQRIWYRSDWREQLGMAPFRTTDDLWTFMERVAAEDLDGTGASVFPLAAPGGWNLTSLIVMWAGMDLDGWSQYNGEWIPNFANPAILPGVQWLRNAFELGYIDPEFALAGWEHSLELMVTGRAAVVPRNGGDPWWLMRTSRVHSNLMGDDWNEWDSWSSGILGIMDPLIAPGRTRTYWLPRIDSGGRHYGKGESHGIPYRCLTPAGLDNVLVAGRSISCDRQVQGSVRVMPVCLCMGEAAGLAGAFALLSGNLNAHEVDTVKLRGRLREEGAYLP